VNAGQPLKLPLEDIIADVCLGVPSLTLVGWGVIIVYFDVGS
jgi:hypothetical protein